MGRKRGKIGEEIRRWTPEVWPTGHLRCNMLWLTSKTFAMDRSAMRSAVSLALSILT
jgi:hypothetical protein